MKFNPKTTLLFCCMATAMLLSACGTRHISRDISPQGVAGAVVFPSAESAMMKDGTFPNLDDLRLIAPGMTKDQLYQLLGRPHFREGYAGVREWDYLFHFRKDGKIITCQYKVIYDKDYLAQSFHWAPAACADVLTEAAPMANVVDTHFNLSADALFAFGKYGAGDILPAGREELSAIAIKLKDADSASISVVGHTDRIGSETANQLLSLRRAQTVRDYLAGQGVSSGRITAQGRGESDPLKECSDSARRALIACLAPNRRVQIEASASAAAKP